MTSLAHAQLLQISPKTGVKSVYEGSDGLRAAEHHYARAEPERMRRMRTVSIVLTFVGGALLVYADIPLLTRIRAIGCQVWATIGIPGLEC